MIAYRNDLKLFLYCVFLSVIIFFRIVICGSVVKVDKQKNKNNEERRALNDEIVTD